MKFHKSWLKQFVKEYKITYTKRKSNQKKFTKAELVTLREPINKLLLDNGFRPDRVINMDETGLPLTESHQKGTFTTESENLENFKPSCLFKSH